YGQSRLTHACERRHEGLHVSDLAGHEELQSVNRSTVLTKIDEAFVDDFRARLGRDVASEIDIQFSGDLQVVGRPGVSHGIAEGDSASTRNSYQGVRLSRSSVGLHRPQM